MASERAAIGVTATPVPWHAGRRRRGHRDGQRGRDRQPFRSLRGDICRDVRQSIDKNGEPHAQTVTLCRVAIKTGATLWVTAKAD